MVNLFVCHTPYHYYLSSLIVRNYYSSNFCNIAFVEGRAKTKLDVFDKVITTPSIGGSVIRKGKEVESSLDKIKIEAKKNKLKIFMSDVAWPLCNRIFFAEELSGNEFCFFSDGIGAYRGNRKNKTQIIKDGVKEVLGKTGLSSDYKNFYGHPLGYDQPRANALYIPNPLKVNYQNINAIDVPLPTFRKESEEGNKRLLFLDQPLWIIERESWERRLNSAIDYVKRNYPGYDFYFKLHHRSREKEKMMYLENGFLEVDQNYCIEELVAETDYKKVFSFYSSALVHLKWMLDNKIDCFSFYDQELDRKMNVGDSDVSFYEENGVLRIII